MRPLKLHFTIGLAIFHITGICLFAAGKHVGNKTLFKAGDETKMPYVQLESVYQEVHDQNGHAVNRIRRSHQNNGRKHFSFDDVGWSIAFLPGAILLQILVLCILWCTAKCMKKSPCRILSKSALFTFICWMTYLIGCTASNCTAYGSVLGLLSKLSIAMIILSYLFMLIESLFSNEKQYITNILPEISAIEFVNKLRNTDSERVMQIRCFHWETRERTFISRDSQGTAEATTQTYQKMVTTYTESQNFPIQFTQDISDHDGLKFNQHGATRLKLIPDIQYGDTETEEKFEEMRAQMIAENEHRDERIAFTFHDSIPGFKRRICTYPNNRPFWLNAKYYWVTLAVGLTWIYRSIFLRKTAKCEYTIKKLIYFHVPSDSTGCMGQINVQMPKGLDNSPNSRTETVATTSEQQAQSHEIDPPHPAPTECRPTVADNSPPTNNPANASFGHASNEQQTDQPYPLATN